MNEVQNFPCKQYRKCQRAGGKQTEGGDREKDRLTDKEEGRETDRQKKERETDRGETETGRE